jgi:hypothetical protein
MNCARCNATLPERSQFCPICGTPARSASTIPDPAGLPLTAQDPSSAPTTVFPPQSQSGGPEPWIPTLPLQSNNPPQKPLSPSDVPGPLPYYQAQKSAIGANMLPATINTQPANTSKRTRRGGAGCFLGCLTALVIVLLVLGAGWLFGVRPYLHNIAQSEIDAALNSATSQVELIPPQLLVAQGPIVVSEKTINNAIVLNLTPNGPVQHPTTHITPNGIRIDFQLIYQGLTAASAITAVPKVQNGQLVVTNVTVEGPLSFVMSSDEMSVTLNKHIADLQAHLKHSVQQVTLKQGEMDIQFGP